MVAVAFLIPLGFLVQRYAEERAIADAEIRFRTLAFPSPELEQMMRETAARIGLS